MGHGDRNACAHKQRPQARSLVRAACRHCDRHQRRGAHLSGRGHGPAVVVAVAAHQALVLPFQSRSPRLLPRMRKSSMMRAPAPAIASSAAWNSRMTSGSALLLSIICRMTPIRAPCAPGPRLLWAALHTGQRAAGSRIQCSGHGLALTDTCRDDITVHLLVLSLMVHSQTESRGRVGLTTDP